MQLKSSIFGAALAVVFFAHAAADTQPAAKDRPKPSRRIIVQFVNGSKVVMELLQDQLAVDTQFGKLTIATRNIRRIQFGLHVPKDKETRIAELLEELKNPVFRVRALASKELVSLGPSSYRALQAHAKDGELETTQRVREVLEQIRKTYDPEQLRVTLEDRIGTTKFPVIGRITTPVLKVRAEYFGELELKPSELLSMASLEGAGSKEVSLGAKAATKPEKWLDTGFFVEPHLRLNIRAGGQVDLFPSSPGAFVTGPNGMAPDDIAGLGFGRYLSGKNAGGGPGALMGRIGESGIPFFVGERFSKRQADSGKLFLRIVPAPSPRVGAATPNGSYNVRVSAGHDLFSPREK